LQKIPLYKNSTELRLQDPNIPTKRTMTRLMQTPLHNANSPGLPERRCAPPVTFGRSQIAQGKNMKPAESKSGGLDLQTVAAVSDRTPLASDCKSERGIIRPEVDARRCEGKGQCVAVCPYDVFEVGRLADEAFNAMPFRVKLKLWAHGRKTAYTPNAEACRACGLCVAACPEQAIRLIRSDAGPAVSALDSP
jgi:4Fe-4S ferredoxin